MAMIRRQIKGFTLIETLIALSIYIILIASLVAVNQSSTGTLNKLEERAIAKQALRNVMIDFKQTKNPNQLGRFSGNYQMSHFSYYWEILIESSQDQQTKILSGSIFLKKNRNKAIAFAKDIF